MVTPKILKINSFVLSTVQKLHRVDRTTPAHLKLSNTERFSGPGYLNLDYTENFVLHSYRDPGLYTIIVFEPPGKLL